MLPQLRDCFVAPPDMLLDEADGLRPKLGFVRLAIAELVSVRRTRIYSHLQTLSHL